MKTFGSLPARLGASAGGPAVGLAEGPHALGFVDRHPEAVDYIEVPYEKLRHDPSVLHLQERFPLVLHCASLSVGGFVRPDEATLEDVKLKADLLETPWIGEHLAFILADPLSGPPGGDQDDDPISLTFTVCPALNPDTLEQVVDNYRMLQARFDRPIILENPPQYLVPPGTSMSLTTFISELCAQCDVGLLLDLTHFYITARNMGLDPLRELEHFPLESVIEMHMSGLNTQTGVVWDDHSRPAPEPVLKLFETAIGRVRPKAVTFEYNWTADFSDALLLQQLERTRATLAAV
jgi:uncharacterized protein (UPF0276 family)